MTRKDKIALLNGILKGEKPISAVFEDWPVKTFYEIDDDEDHYKSADGELVSFEEVDREMMSYPKVRIVYSEREKSDVALTVSHKYTDGRDFEPDPPDTGSGFSCPIKTKSQEKAEVPTNPPPEINAIEKPKPPPEPFLSRKDREVMAQGSLYCVR